MEYERIHKLQSGVISPSKLRMKLIGSQRKKEGSNCNSSRTSPSRPEDSEFVMNSLLASPNDDFTLQASSLDVVPVKSDTATSDSGQSEEINSVQPKGLAARDGSNTDTAVRGFRMQLVPKGDPANSSSVHPVRTNEDDNLDYDSTSSFEFHKGERSFHHTVARSLARPTSSKWNDAEKWIMNKQYLQPNILKRSNSQNQAKVHLAASMVRVAPESAGNDNKASVKRVDFCQPALQTGPSKFAFDGLDLCPTEGNDLTEMDSEDLSSSTKGVMEETTGVPAIRSVSMRDMGTEMTPIPSQEPSRSVTPVSSTTPLRSPTSSIPSTPRRADPAPTPTDHPSAPHPTAETLKKELSEQEMKLKTRREIVALGVQLGKMNIAAWASNDEREKGIPRKEDAGGEEIEQIENVKRAAAWEEAERSKHAARFKREEIRIQAWESQQKVRLEAEMRKIESQIEQMRAHAQSKMMKKVASARQKSEEKRSEAEARKSRLTEKTVEQAEYIRQTGRIPSSTFHCCGWL